MKIFEKLEDGLPVEVINRLFYRTYPFRFQFDNSASFHISEYVEKMKQGTEFTYSLSSSGNLYFYLAEEGDAAHFLKEARGTVKGICRPQNDKAYAILTEDPDTEIASGYYHDRYKWRMDINFPWYEPHRVRAFQEAFSHLENEESPDSGVLIVANDTDNGFTQFYANNVGDLFMAKCHAENHVVKVTKRVLVREIFNED